MVSVLSIINTMQTTHKKPNQYFGIIKRLAHWNSFQLNSGNRFIMHDRFFLASCLQTKRWLSTNCKFNVKWIRSKKNSLKKLKRNFNEKSIWFPQHKKSISLVCHYTSEINRIYYSSFVGKNKRKQKKIIIQRKPISERSCSNTKWCGAHHHRIGWHLSSKQKAENEV